MTGKAQITNVLGDSEPQSADKSRMTTLDPCMLRFIVTIVTGKSGGRLRRGWVIS